MPYSNVEQITPIMNEILRIRPHSLIDVGCGLGVYGLLSRIQLDLYFDDQFYKKIFKKHRPDTAQWETRIDAIEGFKDYLDYIPGWVYNNVIFEDIRTALPKVPDQSYDLSIALAVIEHLNKDEGFALIENLKRISKTIIISVPKNVGPQSVPDNDFETHRSQWSKNDFINLGFNKFLPHSGAWLPVYDPTLTHSVDELKTADSISNHDAFNFYLKNELINRLEMIDMKADRITELQGFMLKCLSIKYRIKSILRNFGFGGRQAKIKEESK